VALRCDPGPPAVRPWSVTLRGMAPPGARRRATATVVALLILLAMLVGLAGAGSARADSGPWGSSAGLPAAQLAAASDVAGPRRVEVLALRRGLLDPPVVRQVEEILALAAAEGSELVVLQLSAPGAVSVDALALAEAIAISPVPVAVLAGPIATGADLSGGAALVWLAAGVRALTPDAGVGPIEPVDLAALDAAALDDATLARLARLTRGQAGPTPGASGPDATATATLTAMRTSRLDADTLAAAGLSTTTSGLEPLLVELDGRTVATGTGDVTLRLRADELSVRFHSLGLVRRVLHAATTGPFVYLLLVFGLGLLLFEVFQPGFGVAGLAGVITLAVGVFGLTVLPVVWWAVALVVLGLVLYAIDTSIAGFGAVTLAATTTFALGSWRFYGADALALDPWLVAATTLTALVFFVLVMTTVLRAQAGPEGVVVEDLVGRLGTVRSVLNPEGHVWVDGALWRARWTGEERRAKVGTPVRVHGVDGPLVLVGPFDPSGAAGEDPERPEGA